MILKDVKALLANKDTVFVGPGDTVKTASEKMAASNERALSIVDGDTILGVISEKDIVHKCVAKGLDANTAPVTDILTTNPITIEGQDSVADAIQKMLEGHFHHLPVLENGRPIGMICSDDIPEEYRLLLERFRELQQ